MLVNGRGANKIGMKLYLLLKLKKLEKKLISPGKKLDKDLELTCKNKLANMTNCARTVVQITIKSKVTDIEKEKLKKLENINNSSKNLDKDFLLR